MRTTIKNKMLWSILVLTVAGIVGCTQTIMVTSIPSGAEITVNGRDMGNTPTEITLPTDYPFATIDSCTYRIAVKLKGYQSSTRTLVGHPVFFTDTRPFPKTLNFELLQSQPQASGFRTTDTPAGTASGKNIATEAELEENTPF